MFASVFKTMKTIHYILLIIWLATTKTIIAQPLLQNIEKLNTGQTFAYNIADTNTMQAGRSGQAAVWDFTLLQPATGSYNTQAALPAATAYEQFFAGATLAYIDNFGVNDFRKVIGDTVFSMGLALANQNIIMKYEVPQIQIIRPVAYTDKYSGTTNYKYTYQNTFNYRGGGPYQVEVDGYGILKLPTGTYTNVLRIKTTQTSYDTLDGDNAPSIITQSARYVWYNKYNNVPIMIFDSVAVAAPGFNNVLKNIYYLQNAATATTDVVNDKQAITANFDNSTIVVRGLNDALPGTITVYDITGRLLANTEATQANEAVCQLASTPNSGQVFFIRVINGGAPQTLKYIVY
jgi:hypothetical protein